MIRSHRSAASISRHGVALLSPARDLPSFRCDRSAGSTRRSAFETVQRCLPNRKAQDRLADRETILQHACMSTWLLCRQAESWDSAGREVHAPEQTNLSNIVGGLNWTCCPRKSPGGQAPTRRFETMDSVISAMLDPHEGRARNQAKRHSMGKILCAGSAFWTPSEALT